MNMRKQNKQLKHFMEDGSTVDYYLMKQILSDNIEDSRKAKAELLKKYNNLIAVYFNKFIAAMQEKKLGNYYPNEEYWQDAVITFEKALEGTELGDRMNRKGEIKSVDPKKYFFFARFSGYLKAMNRDILNRLKKEKSEIPYESMVEPNDDKTRSPSELRNIYKEVNKGTPEKEYYKNVLNSSISEIIMENKNNNVGLVLESIQKCTPPRVACKELCIHMPEYKKSVNTIKDLLMNKLKGLGSIEDIMDVLG